MNKTKQYSEKYSAFSYKNGSSPLHKCPPAIKLVLIPIISIVFLFLPPLFICIFAITQFFIACTLRFSLREQFKDLKPVFLYAAMLFIFQLILNLSNGTFSFQDSFSWQNNKETIFALIKLLSFFQSSSLLFRTTTSLELRDGISTIESEIRKIFQLKNKNNFTNAIFLFLNFIPIVSKIWQESKKAYLARGGKRNLKMYFTLLPVLFSVGIKKAYNQARALEIRS